MDIDKLGRRLQRQNKPIPNNRVKVYALVDKITKETIYIGQTKLPLEDRLRAHINTALATSYPTLISTYLIDNDVEIKLLKDYAVLDFNEEKYIREYLSKGHPLLNMTLGGKTTSQDLEQFMSSLHKG